MRRLYVYRRPSLVPIKTWMGINKLIDPRHVIKKSYLRRSSPYIRGEFVSLKKGCFISVWIRILLFHPPYLWILVSIQSYNKGTSGIFGSRCFLFKNPASNGEKGFVKGWILILVSVIVVQYSWYIIFSLIKLELQFQYY